VLGSTSPTDVVVTSSSPAPDVAVAVTVALALAVLAVPDAAEALAVGVAIRYGSASGRVRWQPQGGWEQSPRYKRLGICR
jgi:hypothetical protein